MLGDSSSVRSGRGRGCRASSTDYARGLSVKSRGSADTTAYISLAPNSIAIMTMTRARSVIAGVDLLDGALTITSRTCLEVADRDYVAHDVTR